MVPGGAVPHQPWIVRCRTQRNAQRNRRSLVVPTNASTGRIPRCSRPLRARPTIAAGHCTWLPGYPRLARLRMSFRDRCPQVSHIRRVQRNRVALIRNRLRTQSQRRCGESGRIESGGACRRYGRSVRPGRSSSRRPFGRQRRTTKRPKEPRFRSLQLQCKHRSRHFRTRGPFGQDLH
jgi:hypothetical protein